MGWGVMDYPCEPPEPPRAYCPECGEECETVYFDVNGNIIGCDNCIMAIRAIDWLNEDY